MSFRSSREDTVGGGKSVLARGPGLLGVQGRRDHFTACDNARDLVALGVHQLTILDGVTFPQVILEVLDGRDGHEAGQASVNTEP